MESLSGGPVRWNATRRIVRDVVLAALAGTAAAALVFHVGANVKEPASVAPIKLGDRLAFEQEIVPVRDTRIFDTVAMFSRLPAEPVSWSDAPVPTLRVADVPAPAPVRTAAASVPRLVASADVASGRPVQTRPPTRPVDPGHKAATMAMADEDDAREPIRLIGWSIPGSQYLPRGRDAVVAATTIGKGATAFGNGASNAVTTGASVIGDALSSAGRSVASTFSFD